MTLAQAIRRGAATRAGSIDGPTIVDPMTGVITTCVIGAAWEGLFGSPPSDSATSLETQRLMWPHFPELREERACPTCGTTRALEFLLWHINDYHRWTREQIADWLERSE